MRQITTILGPDGRILLRTEGPVPPMAVGADFKCRGMRLGVVGHIKYDLTFEPSEGYPVALPTLYMTIEIKERALVVAPCRECGKEQPVEWVVCAECAGKVSA